ncbi:MAG TPA: lysylphosphatidylglycerol synthase transmembrane domain-containing protein [Ilumatobacteraceae bacterium]|nr:lysylphosphatidylglycerol synthase transmembrane domain-containing protein [Ilumatobacteraceae bacterium]
MTTTSPPTSEPAAEGDVVTAMADRLRRGTRLFTSVGDQPRARRATDVLLLTTSLIGIVMIGLVAVPEPGYSRAITDFMAALPDALIGMWQLLADLPILWGIIVLGAAFVRRRNKIARDMLLALVVGGVMWLVISRIVNGSWPELDVLLSDAAPPPVFPSARLAIPTALIVTASPHLVRPARRFGYTVIALGSIAALALQASSALGVIAGLLSAAGAAAVVHLIVGSSAGRPSLDDVRYALADMNVPVVDLGVADRQAAGQFSVAARGVDGSRLVVKLYGRDAHDAALVSAVWRTIWLRQSGSPVGLGRLRQVEHEALLTLLAAQAGIVTDSVVTAGATHSDDAVLVLRRTGEPLVAADRFAVLDEAPPPVFTVTETPARLAEMWQLVSTLHEHGIVHGQLDEDHIVLDDGRLGLIDFRGAAVAPTPAQEHSDNAQMFVTTLGLFGRDVAVSALIEHRSTEQIAALLPYLQPTALTPDQRRMAKVMEIDLDKLRSDIAEASGLESPPLIKMRRFTVGSVIRVALPGLAIVMMISALAGIDFEAFIESLQDAIWWLVLIGFIVAQLPRVAQAVSTLGAAPIPLPLGPVYALQLAISYVNLAIPTAAARIAVNIRFFQRQGVAPASAVATGALDGVSGFIVQATLLGSLLLFSSMSLDVDVDGPSSSALQIVAIVGIIVGIAVVGILVVPQLRRFVLGWIHRTAHEAFNVLRGLRSPRRVLMLFGGNLVAELLFATALGLFVQAFGYSLALHELLFINMAVSLLAGLLPIPGGIGVAEGGLIFGLTSFGVPQEAAFAAVMLYRFSTFYLPPIWGYFSLNWLERNRYL